MLQRVTLCTTAKHTWAYGSLPSGFYPHPSPSVSRADNDCESKGISWYTVSGRPIQLLCISEGKEDVFLKHPGPTGAHTTCWIAGNAVSSDTELWLPSPAGAQEKKSWERTPSASWKCRRWRTAHLCFQSKAGLGPTTTRTWSICALNWSGLSNKCWT